MSDSEIIAEIRKRGWEVRETTGPDKAELIQAFFRGWQTPWRSTLAEVLGDVQKNQEPETRTI